MKKNRATLFLSTSAFLLAAVSQSAWALDCNYMLGQDAEYLGKDSGEGPGWSPDAIRQLKKEQAECRQMAKNARFRLKDEFKVKNADSLTDREALKRIDEEVNNRKEAQRRADEKRRDDVNHRYEESAAQQMKMGKEMMDQQDKMLQGLGVNYGNAGGNEDDDDGIDSTELKMYQKMVDSGAAPKCKGKKGQALLDCVDAALDAQ